jgi:hypothetical protein
MTMKLGWLAVALAGLAMVHDPAAARPRHYRAVSPACAPPVYQYGRYIGQDPDPFIRFQLNRDPGTGYISDLTK